MAPVVWFAIACGVLAVLYGVWTSRSVLAMSAGSERMQEISAAVQEGAAAYLNRQYRTIGIVGIVIAIILLILLGWPVALGFVIGAVLSGATGYIGMNISVRSNVRTTEAARQGLAQGLSVAFRAGAVTGMLVAGLALLAVAGYFGILNLLHDGGTIGERDIVDALVALGFGASLISIFDPGRRSAQPGRHCRQCRRQCGRLRRHGGRPVRDLRRHGGGDDGVDLDFPGWQRTVGHDAGLPAGDRRGVHYRFDHRHLFRAPRFQRQYHGRAL
jgi:hypothetical protein